MGELLSVNGSRLERGGGELPDEPNIVINVLDNKFIEVTGRRLPIHESQIEVLRIYTNHMGKWLTQKDFQLKGEFPKKNLEFIRYHQREATRKLVRLTRTDGYELEFEEEKRGGRTYSRLVTRYSDALDDSIIPIVLCIAPGKGHAQTEPTLLDLLLTDERPAESEEIQRQPEWLQPALAFTYDIGVKLVQKTVMTQENQDLVDHKAQEQNSEEIPELKNSTLDDPQDGADILSTDAPTLENAPAPNCTLQPTQTKMQATTHRTESISIEPTETPGPLGQSLSNESQFTVEARKGAIRVANTLLTSPQGLKDSEISILLFGTANHNLLSPNQHKLLRVILDKVSRLKTKSGASVYTIGAGTRKRYLLG